ncbi:hypothetical protein D3C80_1176160 [compost metagenome]
MILDINTVSLIVELQFTFDRFIQINFACRIIDLRITCRIHHFPFAQYIRKMIDLNSGTQFQLMSCIFILRSKIECSVVVNTNDIGIQLVSGMIQKTSYTQNRNRIAEFFL